MFIFRLFAFLPVSFACSFIFFGEDLVDSGVCVCVFVYLLLFFLFFLYFACVVVYTCLNLCSQ